MKNAVLFGGVLAVLTSGAIIGAAQGQLAVTTFGATEARRCYENAMLTASSDSGPCDEALGERGITQSDKKKTLVNRGIIELRNDNIAEAMVDFNDALAIDPDFAEAFANRGNAWYLAGGLDQAMADYETALSLDVSEPWSVWYNVGLVHNARGEADAAMNAFRQSLAAKPDFAPALAKINQ